MLKQLLRVLLVAISAFLFIQSSAQTSTTLTKKQAKKWFEQKAWLHGASLVPHKSINQQEFARQYNINQTYWDKAFAFLSDPKLDTLSKGRYVIDGDNVYATITEDPTKDLEKTKWESHRKYIDLQYVVRGEEKIGRADQSKATVTKEYDAKSDLANYDADGKFYNATPGTFFIFFPSDAHRPAVTPGGNKVDKKLVIKIRYAQ